ncbi:Hypothetical protein NTJ_00539 [Nesidiocoris tenuis]|uniref:Uncharacterized protein n=1 Tax=Nesidiocoris tenuis TaxID=355587 RepID=A0ABN7A9B6_9HEMI|nr:Hypothetical protein NTJ_00539 [Nesidiocoris tenuis]
MRSLEIRHERRGEKMVTPRNEDRALRRLSSQLRTVSLVSSDSQCLLGTTPSQSLAYYTPLCTPEPQQPRQVFVHRELRSVLRSGEGAT